MLPSETRLRPVLVTPPAAEPVTLSDTKEFARVDHSGHDTLIQGLITAAIAYLDGHGGILGRCMINQTWRQDYAAWSSILRLPFADISSVTVKYFDTLNAEQTVSSSHYELREDHLGAYVRFLEGFTSPSLYDDRSDRVRITLVAGYGAAADDVPETIRTAIKMLVSHWYDNNPAGEASQEIPFGVSALLAPNRRVGV